MHVWSDACLTAFGFERHEDNIKKNIDEERSLVLETTLSAYRTVIRTLRGFNGLRAGRAHCRLVA